MSRKILSILCILLGLLILLYPWGKDCYLNYQQQKIMREWQKTFQQVAAEKKTSSDAFKNSRELSKARQREAEEQALRAYIAKHVEGVITIDKIGLKQPILKGVTAKNLEISVASLKNTARAGEVGNYALAGHRNYGYGRNFNRLDELQAGDIIKVENSRGQYRYEVKEKLYVSPEEVWVLQGNGQDREISLITCHPVKNPTQRLIVKGKLIQDW
ncbi:Sortase domain [Syntrophomonas zehnderi OL-4]|uniref:Sortase domain n=1 Tax=Syntrophomonas zehnderi OL-4 TaxID=690567 RepID=A0A0E4GCR5_9FIRM|nr:class D sortase [Syntrophomonas zehnderi]CFX88766.1 Sortase domain [Syntrophomonas zehnderi OL-4]